MPITIQQLLDTQPESTGYPAVFELFQELLKKANNQLTLTYFYLNNERATLAHFIENQLLRELSHEGVKDKPFIPTALLKLFPADTQAQLAAWLQSKEADRMKKRAIAEAFLENNDVYFHSGTIQKLYENDLPKKEKKDGDLLFGLGDYLLGKKASDITNKSIENAIGKEATKTILKNSVACYGLQELQPPMVEAIYNDWIQRKNIERMAHYSIADNIIKQPLEKKTSLTDTKPVTDSKLSSSSPTVISTLASSSTPAPTPTTPVKITTPASSIPATPTISPTTTAAAAISPTTASKDRFETKYSTPATETPIITYYSSDTAKPWNSLYDLFIANSSLNETKDSIEYTYSVLMTFIPPADKPKWQTIFNNKSHFNEEKEKVVWVNRQTVYELDLKLQEQLDNMNKKGKDIDTVLRPRR